MMMLICRHFSYMPVMELENDSEPVWVKVFTRKTFHFVASWHRQPNGTVKKKTSSCFETMALDHIKSHVT